MVFSLACTVLDETDEVNAIPFDQLDCEKTALFGVFPIFVPSLSWQNDSFNLKMAKKCRFLTCNVVALFQRAVRNRLRVTGGG